MRSKHNMDNKSRKSSSVKMQGYDVIEEIYNEKTAAMNFVHEICKTRMKGNLEAFMTLSISVMNEYLVRSCRD